MMRRSPCPLWTILLSTCYILADSFLFGCFAASPSSSSATLKQLLPRSALRPRIFHKHESAWPSSSPSPSISPSFAPTSSPSELNSGSESTFRVRQVQIIHRHGDRTPITPMKNEPYWHATLPEPHVLQGIARGTKLKREENTPVHGARGRGPFGQLTMGGLLQMVQLGERLKDELSLAAPESQDEVTSDQKLRQGRFANGGKLFTPREPLDPRRIQVMSTDFPRTIQSVQALLTGMFPETIGGEESQDSIEIDLRQTNSFLIPDPQPRQYPHQIMLERHLSSRPHLRERETQLEELARKVTDALEGHLGDGADGVSFGIGEEKDANKEEQTSQRPPLPWAQMSEILVCLHTRNLLPDALSEHDVHAVSHHVAWRWFENLRHPVLAKSSMWKFASKLVDSMERKAVVDGFRPESTETTDGIDALNEDSVDEPMLCIYSAHDSTLIGLLCIFQLEQPAKWPEYGSYLKIDLIHEEVETDENEENEPPKSRSNNQHVLQHWVRFSLNGQVLRSMWMKDDNGQPVNMVPLQKLAEMIHAEHEIEEEGDEGIGLKFAWKDGELIGMYDTGEA